MEFAHFLDPTTRERIITITLTDYDIANAHKHFSEMDRRCLREWGIEESSIEEKLMALQLYARVLEKLEQGRERINDRKT